MRHHWPSMIGQGVMLDLDRSLVAKGHNKESSRIQNGNFIR
ncbi:hypothetical protein RSSM_00051 [Rhodopirellula sallentina SM41]|uniref:Uncharacterized protein n=1 Tax=Rhodopirellula sallentina SM41 TaxID=1263870 RepID=M5UB41_9BACT|nr:hypothetical protein RSSM_00051 [Rhodopirellula sallentina SM41]